MKKLAIFILTKNEEIHIERCISFCKLLTKNIYVLDSYSSDKTKEIAIKNNAIFLQNSWSSYSDQINFGLKKFLDLYEWVLRIDADEIISKDLANEIRETLNYIDSEFTAISIPRRISFLGQKIRFGGIFPMHVVRLVKPKFSICEQRIMDEHILTSGKVFYLKNELLDDNLNDIYHWIEKHNNYSSLEANQIFIEKKSIYKSELKLSSKSKLRRIFKELIYLKTPIFLRCFLYFVYRYFFRAGFLDGIRGFAFHFLQGFWYRFLVDLKLYNLINKRVN